MTKQPNPARTRRGLPSSGGVTAIVRIRVKDWETLYRIQEDMSAAQRGDALAQVAVKRDAPKGE